jgi:hypothetical protein
MTLRFRKTKKRIDLRRKHNVLGRLNVAACSAFWHCLLCNRFENRRYYQPVNWEHAIRTSINPNMPSCGILITTILAEGHFTNVVILMR